MITRRECTVLELLLKKKKKERKPRPERRRKIRPSKKLELYREILSTPLSNKADGDLSTQDELESLRLQTIVSQL